MNITIIKESTVEAFHKRLSALTATEPKRTAVCTRATCILSYEANKRSREVRLEGDFKRSDRVRIFHANRATRDWRHYDRVNELLDNIQSNEIYRSVCRS